MRTRLDERVLGLGFQKLAEIIDKNGLVSAHGIQGIE